MSKATEINNIKNSLNYYNFIYDEVFDYFKIQNCENERYRYLNKKNKRFFFEFTFLINILTNIYNSFVLRRISKKNNPNIVVLFLADPIIYKDLISDLNINFWVFITNPFKNIFRRKNIRSLLLKGVTKNLVCAYEKNNLIFLEKAISKIEILLRSSKINFIILNDSIHPLNRAMILVSKKLNITTIEIQHAIYPSEMVLMKGLGPDFVFVWGDFFKNMYIRQKVREVNTVQVLGYPFKLIKEKYQKKSKKIILYYLAQGFHLQNINNLDILLSNALFLKKLCEEFDVDFRCRLHPNSPQILLDKVLPHINCTPKNETIEDSILNGDIFISFNSTALIQAELNNKICLQLINIPVETDNFEKLGTSIKSFYNIDDMRIHIIDIINNFEKYNLNKKRNNKYVQIFSESPGNKFEILISEILKNENKKI